MTFLARLVMTLALLMLASMGAAMVFASKPALGVAVVFCAAMFTCMIVDVWVSK